MYQHAILFLLFLRLLPPSWIFYLLSSCHTSHMKSKSRVNHYISHMNWYCVYKPLEEGGILTEIPQRKVLSGTEFWTCDLPTQIYSECHSSWSYFSFPGCTAWSLQRRCRTLELLVQVQAPGHGAVPGSWGWRRLYPWHHEGQAERWDDWNSYK